MKNHIDSQPRDCCHNHRDPVGQYGQIRVRQSPPFDWRNCTRSPIRYPNDNGCIPQTTAKDDDPFGILTLSNTPTSHGCIYHAHLQQVSACLPEISPHKILVDAESFAGNLNGSHDQSAG